jgi:hypothetical protein
MVPRIRINRPFGGFPELSASPMGLVDNLAEQ